MFRPHIESLQPAAQGRMPVGGSEFRKSRGVLLPSKKADIEIAGVKYIFGIAQMGR